MSKATGLGDRLAVGGFHLSGDIGSVQQIGGGPAPLEVTGIDKDAFERLGGLRNGGIQFSAFFNKATGQAHPVLSALPRTDVIATYAKGAVLGNAVASCVGVQVNYDPTRGQDGSLTFATAVQSDSYGLEWGEQLTDWQRTDTTGTNGASLDQAGAATTFGAQFYLQMFSVAGTSCTVKIQDSADSASFADLAGASFAAVLAGATSAQRIAVTGTVRRYLRAVSTGTFSSAVFSVQATRNLTAVSF